MGEGWGKGVEGRGIWDVGVVCVGVFEYWRVLGLNEDMYGEGV